MKTAYKSIITIVLVGLWGSLLPVPIAQAQPGTSYIIVHAHNPEGVEINSIDYWFGSLIRDWHGGVQIYDGDAPMDFAAYDAVTHGLPIPVSPGTHTIKARFNGMTLQQEIDVPVGATKVIVFTFEREEVDTQSLITSEYSDSWYGEKIVPPSSSSDIFADMITGTFVNYGGSDSHATIGGSGSFHFGPTMATASISGTANIEGPDAQVDRVYSRHWYHWYKYISIPASSQYDSWFVQNYIKQFPDVDTSEPWGRAHCWLDYDTEDAFVLVNLVDYAGNLNDYRYYFREASAKKAWTSIMFYLDIVPAAYSPEGDFVNMLDRSPQGTTNTFTCDSTWSFAVAGGLTVKMSTVPYDLTGTGVKDEINQPPVASFTYSPEKPFVVQEITFDASSSYDSDGDPITYKWDLDNDGTIDSTQLNPIYTYSQPRTYTVKLVVNDGHADSSPAYANIEVKPVPVLLVHGIWSSPGMWDAMESYLQGQGFDVYRSSYAAPYSSLIFGGCPSTNKDIKGYAQALYQEIKAIKAKTGAPKVDLVCHSMGGLVARWCTTGLSSSDVRTLIMIGTPNHGSELLYGRYVAWLLKPAFGLGVEFLVGDAGREMTPESSFLLMLNSTSLPANIRHEVIAGTKGWPITSWVLWGDDDGVVRKASATLAGAGLDTVEEDHTHECQSKDTFDKVGTILEQPASVGQGGGALLLESDQAADVPTQQAPAIFAHISPGEQHSHDILVSAAIEMTIALTWSGSDLDLTLTTPSGTLIDPSVAEIDPSISYHPDDGMTAEGYTILSPEAGTWQANVAAVDVPPEGEAYAVMTFLETTINLSLNLSKYQYDPGEQISIVAELQSDSMPLTGASVTAEIERPDESVDSLALYDDGLHGDGEANDGVYANAYANTATSGAYDITVSANGTADSVEFARQAFATVWVEQYPDLTLSSEDISFSVDNPIAGEQITINAVIHNIGDVEANESTIMFYDGDPASGSLIGEDTISVPVGGTETASASWTALAGTHEMVGVISPFNSFLEKDYTNNEASRTINVSSAATATCMVSLQGSSRPNPAGWQIPVTVKFFAPGANVLSGTPVYVFSGTTTRTSENAALQVTGISPGTYDITVVSEHTLMNVKRNVVIAAASTQVDMGTLLEGDWNGNLAIDWEDLGTVLLTYDKCEGNEGFNPTADFNRNGCIDWEDLGLVLINYDKGSPVEVE